MARHLVWVHWTRGGLRRPAGDSAPLADSTRVIFLPNPPRAAKTCHWAVPFDNAVLVQGENPMSTIDDLSPEQIEQIEKHMQKGEFSQTGFLNSGERLQDIIEKDAQTLKEFGITHKQISDRLESIIGKAHRLAQLAQRGWFRAEKESVKDSPKNLWHILGKLFGQESVNQNSEQTPIYNIPLIENLYCVSTVGYYGVQECPFVNPDGKPCQEMTNFDYVIERPDTNTKISFSGLIIHLIRDHKFFEGTVHYRLEPKQAISLLDIQPNYDYTPSRATEKIWQREQGTTGTLDELDRLNGLKIHYQTPIRAADKIIKLSDKTCLYLWNGICVSVSSIDYKVSKEFLVDDRYWSDSKIERGVWVYKPHSNIYVEI